MMYLTSDENFQYFCYNGKNYKTGTVVELNDVYINENSESEESLWRYAQFSHRILSNHKSKYFFFAYKAPPSTNSCSYICFFTIPSEKIESAIKEIVKPIEVVVSPKIKRKDSESPDVIVGWALYIFVLIFSFIFKQWYLIWLCGSIYFFIWRNMKLWG